MAGNSMTHPGIIVRYTLTHHAKEPHKEQDEVCPRDQHPTDMVPVIVGSCLAGLIVITMVTYLIYRCQLPAEVLQLTSTDTRSSNAGSGDHPHIISTNTIIRPSSLED
ncbi:hypothetical protein TELCIR_08017 [Teladorsagia circumcincta]|uniref:Uncharacterized protein n=1 Tax=Teladorsagia circumcincta TaxID=45464 RepID=A0A2G9UKY0_TELCI|nr:hypothetical protein TELCIR_08017 [Teladorsagia circumcincta]